MSNNTMERILINWIMLMIFISVVNTKAPSKIINGEDVFPQDYPYLVSIRVQNTHICGGAILSAFHVASAATCITLGGNSNIVHGNIIIFIKDGIFNTVSYVILHPEYETRRFFANDVSILKSATPIHMVNPYMRIGIQSIVIKVSNNGKLVGWSSDQNELVRQFLRVATLSRQRCLFFYEIFGGPHQTQSCVSPVSNDARINQGDGGNPVVFPDSRMQRLQGIVSVISVHANYPIIFTRLPLYNHWIDDIVTRF